MKLGRNKRLGWGRLKYVWVEREDSLFQAYITFVTALACMLAVRFSWTKHSILLTRQVVAEKHLSGHPKVLSTARGFLTPEYGSKPDSILLAGWSDSLKRQIAPNRAETRHIAQNRAALRRIAPNCAESLRCVALFHYRTSVFITHLNPKMKNKSQK